MTEPRKERTVVTPEMVEEMIRLRAEGVTYREVAERLGVSEMTVYHRMRQAKEKAEAEKIEPVPDPEPEPEKVDTAEKIAQMQAMRDKGMATDTIARKMRVKRDYVLKHTISNITSKNPPLPEPKGCTLPKYLHGPTKIHGRGAEAEKKKLDQMAEDLIKPGKDTTDKARLSLVPPGIIEAVGEVRTFGTEKYGCPENWRTVEPELYVDALMRHLVRYLRDPKAVDEESGLSHLWHMACNAAFLIEMEADVNEKRNGGFVK